MPEPTAASSLSFRIVLIVFLAHFAIGRAASAQQTINYATVSGRVTDPTDAVISGADVVARETETNLTSSTTTDSEGRFRFPYLRPGPYEITVRAAFGLAVSLNVASLATEVEVSGQQDVLETARTQVAGTVPQTEVTELPVNGRNFLDVALLVPGVSPTNTASNQLFAETSAVPGQGLSVNSQRNFSNGFIVDGLSAGDDAAGLSGVFYGYDTVSEFQVVTAGGQAEFGRALGGYMNVITKSGTNTLHGGIYGYFRNQRFNAANPLSQTLLPITQAQYGVTLGGPIVKDRSFYFSNFEQRNLNQSGLIRITPANVTLIN